MGQLKVVLPTAADTHQFGIRLGRQLRAGDLVILSGGLGAGKTAMTKGIAEGLDVTGPVTSPTFVISRVHPPRDTGPSLVHVDAYRLASGYELDDLDLYTDLTRAAVVVEWGVGLAEVLSQAYLLIDLDRRPDDSREAAVIAHGGDWVERLTLL